MEIPNNLKEDINLFCKVNNIEDVDKFIIKMLRQGFNVEKYGKSPNQLVNLKKEKVAEIIPVKEVIIEKTQEIKTKEEKKQDLYDED